MKILPQPPDRTPGNMNSATIERPFADQVLAEIEEAAKELRQLRRAWKERREQCLRIMIQFATGVRK